MENELSVRSPKQVEKYMDRLFDPRTYKVWNRTKWIIPKWNLDDGMGALNFSVINHPSIIIRDFDISDESFDSRDLSTLKLATYWPKEHGQTLTVPDDLFVIEINYNWFYRRTLMAELNWFQIMVGKIVRIF